MGSLTTGLHSEPVEHARRLLRDQRSQNEGPLAHPQAELGLACTACEVFSDQNQAADRWGEKALQEGVGTLFARVGEWRRRAQVKRQRVGLG